MYTGLLAAFTLIPLNEAGTAQVTFQSSRVELRAAQYESNAQPWTGKGTKYGNPRSGRFPNEAGKTRFALSKQDN